MIHPVPKPRYWHSADRKDPAGSLPYRQSRPRQPSWDGIRKNLFLFNTWKFQVKKFVVFLEFYSLCEIIRKIHSKVIFFLKKSTNISTKKFLYKTNTTPYCFLRKLHKKDTGWSGAFAFRVATGRILRERAQDGRFWPEVTDINYINPN